MEEKVVLESMGTLRIRTMTETDVPEVHAAEAEIFSDAWSESSVKSALCAKEAICFVCRTGDRLCGYVLGQEVVGEAELHRIAVLPKDRKKGMGAMLLSEFIRRCEEAGAFFQTLEVRAGNEAALSLYRKFGFREEGRRVRYYHHPEEDGLILSRHGKMGE